MPIIGKVGRKSFKMRVLNSTIHLVLLIGAITMIYPFMMMVSASFKSDVDSKHFSLYPEYFTSSEMLLKKYVEARMNEESNLFIEQYRNKYLAFEFLEKPSNPVKQKFDDWQQFLQERSAEHTVFDYYISEQYGRGVYPRNERKFRDQMKLEADKSLENFNEKYDTSILSWDEVRVEERNILSRNFSGDYQGYLGRYKDFRQELPLWHRVYASLDGNFIANELVTNYRGRLDLLNESLGTNFPDWQNITLSTQLPECPLQKHWVEYVKKQVNIHHVQVDEKATELYRDFLQEKYSDIFLLNDTYKTSYSRFSEITIPFELPRSGALLVDWSFFVENIVPPEFLIIKSVEIDFRNWLKQKYSSIDELNRIYKNGFDYFAEIELTEQRPKHNLTRQNDWQVFVQQEAAVDAVGLLMTSQMEFRDFVKSKFRDPIGEFDLEEMNVVLGTNFKDEMNIYPAKVTPEKEEYKKLWLEFVTEKVSAQFLTVDKSEQQKWQDFLQNKYDSIEDLNTKYGLLFNDFSQVVIDNQTIDYFIFKEHKKDIFNEFTKRNYVMVLDVMLYNGRAIVNTLIYCSLAIITALLVNPLAAYAMSRFKLRATYKIILVLMLTMAFPPMVMGIPSFLLLKKFNMLNTFFALILPAAADGYFIFLLKGFFDSLPQELFESATVDGASETRIFWQIAMSLSKPIMAVIALGAFNAAYRNFMFAFIVCQDKSMWTMMVHIYQLMQRSAPGVGFAALVIAAIPTFVVFVFFQNIIIRGIVVPTEK